MYHNLLKKLVTNLSKLSRPLPKSNKLKQQKKSLAAGDQKSAKLSKSQLQLQNKQKLVQEQKIIKQTQRKLKIYKKQDISLEEYMSKSQLDMIYQQQLIHIKGVSRKLTPKKIQQEPQKVVQNYAYQPNQLTEFDPKTQMNVKKKPLYGNYTAQINQRYKSQIQPYPQDKINKKIRRMGSLGIKLGMTTLWDKWGHVVPATVLHFDRVQVVQIKKANDGFSQVQMGIGAANLKKITKPLLGHYLKARVPPKRKLVEFKVSQQCVFPVGYMMNVRHYTPGMFVDVLSKTVGHGFQGTIKRYGFRRQPASHGNSLTTRVLGSTGGRQDPGRVFKQKKMYGHMGCKMSVQRGMKVFKIDVDKNLLYIYGSVPGKAGTIVQIRDTLIGKKAEQNLKIVSFPTFIQQEGVKYPRQMSMYCGERDPGQIQIHDNAYIIDGDDEDAATTTSKQMPEQ